MLANIVKVVANAVGAGVAAFGTAYASGAGFKDALMIGVGAAVAIIVGLFQTKPGA